MYFREKVHSGKCGDVERSICETVVQNDGSSGPSSGDSELAAVVRAATEGSELQSILSDFDLCGHVAIKSDATAAIGMFHRLGSVGENSRLQNVGVGESE